VDAREQFLRARAGNERGLNEHCEKSARTGAGEQPRPKSRNPAHAAGSDR